MPTLPLLTTRLPATTRSNCMCVWPHTTTSASRSANKKAMRSSGVSSVKMSRSLRGDACTYSTVPICALAGCAWRNSICSSVSTARVASRNSGGARPSSSGWSSRSALPRIQTTRSPSARSRSSVSLGCSPPATTSPPTTIVAPSGISSSTASSARRFPCTSYSVATVSASTHDLELQAAPGVRSPGADERAQRTRDPALAADHLADVALGDVQAQDERAVVAVGLLDAHRVRLVHEPAGELLEQLLHDYLSMPLIFKSRATVSDGCAPFCSHAFTFSSSSSMRDGSDCGL